ncbi:MAG: hypothetical protein LUG83_05935 [Lachnospiraceae bacterium]|nr:hypothetical protein [Lachnospiraceae bacterium]
MSEITTAGRLELVRQLRESYNHNMYDMSTREKILYGRTTRHGYDDILSEMNEINAVDTDTAPVSRGLFRIRFLAAAFLFLLVFTMNSRGLKIAGYGYEDIYNAISCDYIESVEVWINGLQAQ